MSHPGPNVSGVYLAQILGGPDDGTWVRSKTPEIRFPVRQPLGVVEVLVYRFERRTWTYSPVWRLDHVETLIGHPSDYVREMRP